MTYEEDMVEWYMMMIYAHDICSWHYVSCRGNDTLMTYSHDVSGWHIPMTHTLLIFLIHTGKCVRHPLPGTRFAFMAWTAAVANSCTSSSLPFWQAAMIRSMSNAASTLDVAALDALASGALTKEPNVSLPEPPSTVRGFFFCRFCRWFRDCCFYSRFCVVTRICWCWCCCCCSRPFCVAKCVCVCVSMTYYEDIH